MTDTCRLERCPCSKCSEARLFLAELDRTIEEAILAEPERAPESPFQFHPGEI
jgi:hypothetical protein